MTAISVTDYVLSVISDSKYGGDIEWVKMNLDPSHVRRIEAEYTRQQREEAYDEGVEVGRYYSEDMTYAPLSPYRYRKETP